MKILGKFLIVVIFCAFLVDSSESTGKNIDKNWISDSLIRDALKKANEFYSDVPSSLNCKKQRKRIERLICKNRYLQRIELLSARAQAYAIENATKTEINHKSFVGEIPMNCKTEQCIYEFFAKRIESSSIYPSMFKISNEVHDDDNSIEGRWSTNSQQCYSQNPAEGIVDINRKELSMIEFSCQFEDTRIISSHHWVTRGRCSEAGDQEDGSVPDLVQIDMKISGGILTIKIHDANYEPWHYALKCSLL
jgi:uncharacterized protein